MADGNHLGRGLSPPDAPPSHGGPRAHVEWLDVGLPHQSQRVRLPSQVSTLGTNYTVKPGNFVSQRQLQKLNTCALLMLTWYKVIPTNIYHA